MKSYTAAVIGVGKAGGGGKKGGGHAIGYLHGGAFRDNPRTTLAMAADINAENLECFRQKFEVPRGFADYREMLREGKPEIVSICTYVGLHRQMVEDCARAGVKGIFLEKPIVASPADLVAVDEVVRQTGVKIVVAHIRRYFAAFLRLRELYQNGTVGQPLLCAAGIQDWDLSEWGSHWLDMFRHFHNDLPVKWVFGQMRVRQLRGYGHAMEDHGCAYFEFEGGGKGLVDGGRGMAGPWTMTLVGTEGTLRLQHEHLVVIENARGRSVEDYAKDQVNCYERAWCQIVTDLIHWIEGGPVPLVGWPSMRQSAELNLAAYLSAIQGDRIDLPLSGDDLKLAEWPVEVLARRR
jgi:predicted dehydrogenase